MTPNRPHLRLRIEPALLDALNQFAEANHRTLTGEIIRRLEESFRQDVLATARAEQIRLSLQVSILTNERDEARARSAAQ
jgi:hypothetical protein